MTPNEDPPRKDETSKGETGETETCRKPFATYLRVSVTDRCNFRCRYCIPPESIRYIPHGEILRYEEIERVVRVASAAGVRKIRLTGGEPLVRRDLPSLVEKLASLDGLDEICLTTNGSLLSRFARTLKRSGLSRVTVSLDSLHPDRFTTITGGGELEPVMAGIEEALEAGLTPLKVNAVALKGANDDEIPDFVALASRLKIEVRFIEYMPMGEESWRTRFLSAKEVEKRIRRCLAYEPEVRTETGPAARKLVLRGGGSIGLIAPISAPFCASCDRLRLTAAGTVRACLIAGGEVDLRDPLRSDASDETLLEILRKAWSLKPPHHGLNEREGAPHPLECQGMRSIGG